MQEYEKDEAELLMMILSIWILVAHGSFGARYSDAYKNPYASFQFESKIDCLDAAQKVSTQSSTYTCENIRVLGQYSEDYKRVMKK